MEYSEIQAVNWSTLVHLATSPLMLEWRRDHPRAETRALRVGTAIHCAVLEPEAFGTRYAVAPDVDRRTKVGKAEHAAWLEALRPGAQILEADEHELAVRCGARVLAHPGARGLLSGGRTEEIVQWHDAATGLGCKGRVDYLTPHYLVDLKSTRADTLPHIARELAGRLYHGQVAWYLDGARAARVVSDVAEAYVIAVQTVEPYDVIPARLLPEDLERGRSLYRSLLRRYAECQAAGWWPGLAPTVIDLPLPAWAPAGEPEPTGDAW